MYKIWSNNDITEYGATEVSLFRLLNLYLKVVYSTWMTRIVIILSPMLVALALSAFFTPYFQVGAGQVFVTSLSSGVIWGMTYFSMRKTTLHSNLSGTRVSRYLMYTAIILTMIIVTACSQVTYWGTIIILDKVGFTSLLSLVINVNHDWQMNWLDVDWFTLLYTWLMSVTLMFLGSFATRNIFSTENSYFVVLLCYILYLVGFGGLILPELSGANGYIEFTSTSNPLKMILQFAMPQYSINMFNFVAVLSGVEYVDGGVVNTWRGIEPLEAFKWSQDWRWNYVIVYPWVIYAFLGTISIFTIEFYK